MGPQLLLLLLIVVSSAALLPEEAAREIFGDERRFVFSAKSSQKLPQRLFPEVGNGNVATQIGGDFLFLSGLYNGAGTNSQRASVPSPLRWSPELAADPAAEWSLDLNSAIGVFFHRIYLPSGAFVEIRTFALRDVPSILVRDLRLLRAQPGEKVVVNVRNFTNFATPDLKLNITRVGDFVKMEGEIRKAETSTSGLTRVYIIFEPPPNEILLTDKNDTAIFLTSANHDLHQAWSDLLQAKRQARSLFEAHSQRWLQLWRSGRISFRGDLLLQRVTQACQYFLLSSLPWPGWNFSAAWPFFGLSPGGLAHGNNAEDYQGHVFWDQETWMYPPVLTFHPALAQRMLDYRFFALPAAAAKAEANAWSGAQFPWESAFTGAETSPWDLSANNEQHVGADISFAVAQFLWSKAPNDTAWYLAKGRSLLDAIAEFWASRVTYNRAADRFEIHGVMPPDEYVHRANNSVFTNWAAARALRAPAQLANYFGAAAEPRYAAWARMAEKMYLPMNHSQPAFHLETDSYRRGTVVKQADVVLLGYPLLLPMPTWLRKNDLDIYEPVTDRDGPAMTWGMFAIGYLELQEEEKAWSLFKRNFDFVRPPFYIWTEVRSGTGAVNFLTGMGGFLQAVVNGYAGLRLQPDCLLFRPLLPPGAQELDLLGLKYRGVTLDVRIVQARRVTFTLQAVAAPSEVILTTAGGSLKLNKVGATAELRWQKVSVTVAQL